MDVVSIVKDITVLIIVPIIFWLRLLIVRQDTIDTKLASIDEKLGIVQEEIINVVDHSFEKIEQTTNNEAIASAKTNAKVEAIESKVDMLLSLSMKN